MILPEMIDRLYPEGTPIYLITDDTSLDAVSSELLVDRVRQNHPRLQVRAHDAFDVLALIPEQRYRKAGIEVRSEVTPV